MQTKDASIFMQSLRGNQSLIVLAFLLVRSALSIEQLEILTGLHNDTVRSAVKGLASKGLLYKQVGEHGRVIYLPAGETFFGKLFDQSPKTSDSGDVVVVVESEESKDLQSTSTTNKLQSPRTSDSGLSADQLLNLAALHDAGIMGRPARRLAALPWVNVEYIRAHAEQVKKEFWDNPQGMMITRIDDEVPAAEFEKKQERYHVRSVDRGKRGVEEFSFAWDIDQEISDYMGHPKGCSCVECSWIITHNGELDSVCPDCKHHECECEETE